MRVLVAGASGFLGRHVVGCLEERGHEVVRASSSSGGDVLLDVADPTLCHSVVAASGADAAVNLAGAGVTAGSAGDVTMARANREGPVNLADACVAHGARMVHVASSTEPLPGMLPESVYSQTKADGTAGVADLMRSRPGHLTIARVHNAYGPDQPHGRLVIDLVREMAGGGEFTVRFPDRVRDFCAVDDVAGVLADLATDPTTADRAFDVGTGVGVALRDVASTVLEIFGAPGSWLHFADGPAADPAPSSVAGDAGLEMRACPTTLARGLEMMRGALR